MSFSSMGGTCLCLKYMLVRSAKSKTLIYCLSKSTLVNAWSKIYPVITFALSNVRNINTVYKQFMDSMYFMISVSIDLPFRDNT